MEPISIVITIICSVLAAIVGWLWSASKTQKTVATLNQQVALLEQTIETQEKQLTRWQQDLQVTQSRLESEEAAREAADIKAAGLNATATQRAARVEELIAEVKSTEEEHAAELDKRVTAEKRVAELESSQKEREEAEQTRYNQMETQFKNLAAEIMSDQSVKLKAGNKESIENLLKPFGENIKSFQDRVNQLHETQSTTAAGLTATIEGLGKTSLKMAQDAKDLTSALKGDNKLAGNWGEALLEKTLQLGGLLKNKHYTRETSYTNDEGSRVRTDFVIKLPDDQNIVIDSKISLEAWTNAVAATEEEDVKRHMGLLVGSIKAHVDGLASKDYSQAVGNTPEFTLMFLGVEPAYLEAMRWDVNIWDYAYSKGVVIVSHTTLLPLLRTIENLWTNHNAGKQVEEIADSATRVYNSVITVVDRVNKMASSLNAASGHYDKLSAALVGQQGLMGRVEKFTAISSAIKKDMPALEDNRMHFGDARMEAVAIEYKEDDAEVALLESDEPEPESGLEAEAETEERVVNDE